MASETRRARVPAELQALSEWVSLRRDPLYRGVGVPHGDGRAVLVLPGLFGNDLYLGQLRSWLSRIGYKPVASTLLLNAGCPERLTRQVERALQRRLANESDRVAVVGHSRGGLLGRAIAARLGRRCSHFVAIGSPVGAILRMGKAWLTLDVNDPATTAQLASRRVVMNGRRATRFLDPDCDAPVCGCPYPKDVVKPLSRSTKVLSLYTRDDGIVAADACSIPGATNLEVGGTHSGLVFNRAVYRALAEALAS